MAEKEFLDHLKKTHLEMLLGDSYAESFDDSIEINTNSSRQRVSVYTRRMLRNFRLAKNGYITTSFHMTLNEETSEQVMSESQKQRMTNIRSIYAILYSDKDGHKYMTLGPSFTSQDGEYRHRFIPFDHYEKIIELYSDVLMVVDELLSKKINDNHIMLTADVYKSDEMESNKMPNGMHNEVSTDKVSKNTEKSIIDSRLPINLMALCWIADFKAIHEKSGENHMNTAYKTVLYDPLDVATYNKIVDMIGLEQYDILANNIAKTHSTITRDCSYRLSPLELGQKYIPSTIRELTELFNIRHSLWRELYFNRLTTKLTLNFISPSFPIMHDWFMVKNGPNSYDNMAMYQKFKQSAVAEDIHDMLVAADGKTMTNDTAIYINNKFKGLSKYVRNSILYNDAKLRLTNISICMVNEHIGRTMRDFSAYITNTKGFIYTATKNFFNDYTAFSKVIFDYIWGFHCLSKKMKIIHGDVHMNNITVGILHKIENHHKHSVVYRLSKDTSYKHEYNGTFGGIIDFSRSIIGDSDEITKEFGAHFANVFMREQYNRIIEILTKHIPEVFTGKELKLENALIHNTDLVIKAMSAIDTYTVCKNISLMLSLDKIPHDPKCMKLVKDISEDARESVISNITGVLNKTISSVDDLKWFNEECMEKYYAGHKCKLIDVSKDQLEKNNEILHDIFSFELEPIYDNVIYERFPPLLRFEKEIEISKKYNLDYSEIISFLERDLRDTADKVKSTLDPWSEQLYIKDNDWKIN